MENKFSRLKYPVGIQTFSKIREEGYVYVDKTALIYRLISTKGYYFLSRPRRFGKSLLLSTIEAFYEGRRDLFKGLALDSLADDWEPHPVLHLDLNTDEYNTPESLQVKLELELQKWEEKYCITPGPVNTLNSRFGDIIEKACKTTGRKVVILIDEYDKPMLNAINHEPLADKFRSMLKAFYGNLKSMDRYIELALLTGVARFSKLSIFSDLNNLRDISFVDEFSAICGITNEEVDTYFQTGVRCLADKYHISYVQARERLREMYDGYHFSEDLIDIYNPFSLVNVFANNKFSNYWFHSGTPSHLARVMERRSFPLHLLSGFKISEDALGAAGIMSNDPIVLLFQSGYLTIKSYDLESGFLTLDFPNREVKESFLKFLVPYYTRLRDTETDFAISQFVDEVNDGRAADFMRRLSSLVANVPYGGRGTTPEDHFQNAIYLVFTLMGYRARVEQRISSGRIDMTVETHEYVYIFEFKVDRSAREAMDQIRERAYWKGFEACGKKIILIAANFDSETRQLSDDIIMETVDI